jgi:hypothetical protein
VRGVELVVGARFLGITAAVLVAVSSIGSSRVEAKGKKPLEDPGAGEDEEPAPSGSYHGPFGLGIVLGEPTGITGKVLFGHYNGIQLHVGYGYEPRGRLVICGDYLFHFMNAIPPIERAGRLAPYIGIGGRLGVRDDNALLGVRVPFGLAFFLNSAPFEIFVEIAIGIGLIPETVAIIDGGLGGRFYF